ncbi:hypothetical protein B0173_03412 [Mycobacterium avium subsp. paratuberculosis]|nr:hypothetical protein B0173_03412 [Mycobacterium avium subsp. paratuberculosis]
MGARLCRFRRGRETQLVACPGVEAFPVGRLGRARRLWRTGTRQFGPPLPHHLGYRPGAGRDLRPPIAGSLDRAFRAPPSGRRTDRRGRRGDRRPGQRAGALRRAARCRVVAKHHSAVRVSRRRGDRDQWRHRRQSRVGAQELAEADGPRPRTIAQRCAGTCRRPDDRDHPAGRCAGDQPGPDVALHRGHHQLRADLAAARHPHHPGPVLAVAGRQRQAAAGSALPGVRHPRHVGVHHQIGLRLHLVRVERQDHREGIRAFRPGAEPRPDRAERARTAAQPGALRAARTGAGVRRPGGWTSSARIRCASW